MNTLGDTEYHFNGQTNFYRGKVREVYSIGDSLLVMVASDRISAFDHVLPKGIPYKGQVLNQIAVILDVRLLIESNKDSSNDS